MYIRTYSFEKLLTRPGISQKKLQPSRVRNKLFKPTLLHGYMTTVFDFFKKCTFFLRVVVNLFRKILGSFQHIEHADYNERSKSQHNLYLRYDFKCINICGNYI